MRMVKAGGFEWLDPPSIDGRMTVLDVLDARTPAEHEGLVPVRAADLWEASTPHHGPVRAWIDRSLR
jgi:hypothetical protein